MEKDYRVFTIRRLFKEDMPCIENYCHSFDSLYFNPFTKDYIWQVMLQGSFWGIFDGESAVATTYVLPADSPAFSSLDASWHIADLLGCSMENSLLCGYLWVYEKYRTADFYTPVIKLWQLQAERKKRRQLLYCMPAVLNFNMEKLLHNGFELVGLRGLDNLVPHYIFAKTARFTAQTGISYRDIQKCNISDSKTVSMLCEHGYKGFDMDVEKNILFGR